MTSVLGQMESRMLANHPPPPKKTFSAEQMDHAVFLQSMHHADLPAIEYAWEWAEDAPEEMFAWLIDKNEGMRYYAHVLFGRWAFVANNAAQAAALRIPDPQLRRQALLTTLEILAQTSPERAKNILSENANVFADVNAKPPFFQSHDIATTWDLLLVLPAGKERTFLQAKFLGRAGNEGAIHVWNQASDAQRLEWMAAGFPPTGGSYDSFAGLQDMMRERAETTRNAVDAARFIQYHGNAWADKDLESAIEWTQTHVKGKQKIQSLRKIYYSGVEKDFQNTLRLWQQMPESYLKTDIAGDILRATPEDRKAEAKHLLGQE